MLKKNYLESPKQFVMKKTLVIILALAVLAPFLYSCTKSCTCVNPDTDKVTEIEVQPNEKCSKLDNSSRKCS